MYGALVTVERPGQEAFSVIMPVKTAEYGEARLLRSLGALRTWLRQRAPSDEVAAAILRQLDRGLGTLDDAHPIVLRLETPKV
ncbi:MAG: hypothetical protein M0Z53_01435 [Thermaerobacter sp.]|nr:hypothetical protein [Thermaerobacter sp.]